MTPRVYPIPPIARPIAMFKYDRRLHFFFNILVEISLLPQCYMASGGGPGMHIHLLHCACLARSTMTSIIIVLRNA